MGYLGDADSQMGSCDSLIAKCCWSLVYVEFWRQTMYIILSWCYGQICHQHWPPGQLYAGRDEDRTLRGLTRYERRLSVSKATNAQPAGYSLSLTWRAPCLQLKHGGLSVVCSASLCIIAGRFYPWSLFSYGRNRKEVLY